MTDHRPFVDGVVAGAFWRAAHYWIGVWTGAGFPPRLDGEKIYMPKGWPEKFPDGPHLMNALRNELVGLLSKGNAAVAEDERLKIPVFQPLYLEHLARRIDDGVRHSAQARRAAGFWERGNSTNDPDPASAEQARAWAARNDKEIERLRLEAESVKKKKA